LPTAGQVARDLYPQSSEIRISTVDRFEQEARAIVKASLNRNIRNLESDVLRIAGASSRRKVDLTSTTRTRQNTLFASLHRLLD
jgi:hypothetical protein